MQFCSRDNNEHKCKICESTQAALQAMDKQEKNLHLWLDQALMGGDMSHKSVKDMTSIWKKRVQYMVYT